MFGALNMTSEPIKRTRMSKKSIIPNHLYYIVKRTMHSSIIINYNYNYYNYNYINYNYTNIFLLLKTHYPKHENIRDIDIIHTGCKGV